MPRMLGFERRQGGNKWDWIYSAWAKRQTNGRLHTKRPTLARYRVYFSDLQLSENGTAAFWGSTFSFTEIVQAKLQHSLPLVCPRLYLCHH